MTPVEVFPHPPYSFLTISPLPVASNSRLKFPKPLLPALDLTSDPTPVTQDGFRGAHEIS